MKTSFLIHNARIINEGRIFSGYLLVNDGLISEVGEGGFTQSGTSFFENYDILDAGGSYLMPGVIDDQVHFREPGLTHKGDIASESRAAVAGGVTSFMEMPNTVPQTVTMDLVNEKKQIAAAVSPANYSFFLGATNENLNEIRQADMNQIPGIKLFMGSSTGNMLVDDQDTLEAIFRDAQGLVAIHSEYEPIIKKNTEIFRQRYGENVPIECHPQIRSNEACFRSTERAVNIARKYNTRLHVLHVSTEEEMALFSTEPYSPLKRITAEVCVHHLWFDDRDYSRYGTRIKWNPAIKAEKDKLALRQALIAGAIDVVATDHAPHTLEEKSNTYFKAPSGGPLVQHSLPLMFELVRKGIFTPEMIADKMCHTMANCFGLRKRGFLRPGYWADLVILNPDQPFTIQSDNILYKCGWSPWEGETLSTSITHTFVNGNLVYANGLFPESPRGMAMEFTGL
jgi:dihydroorotase